MMGNRSLLRNSLAIECQSSINHASVFIIFKNINKPTTLFLLILIPHFYSTEFCGDYKAEKGLVAPRSLLCILNSIGIYYYYYYYYYYYFAACQKIFELVFLPFIRVINCLLHFSRSSASSFSHRYLDAVYFFIICPPSVLQWHLEEGNFFLNMSNSIGYFPCKILFTIGINGIKSILVHHGLVMLLSQLAGF